MIHDIKANRASKSWTKKEKMLRFLWALCTPLFRYSPRPFWGWRRLLLRCFGAHIGKEVHIDPSVRVFIPWNLVIGDWSAVGFEALLYNLGPLTIGSHVTISQRAHLCGGTHDYQKEDFPLIKSTINVKDNVWICADSFISPGVIIAEGAIIGARAVVTKNVEPNAIMAGNPAMIIGHRPVEN